jgi:hypothetical protein
MNLQKLDIKAIALSEEKRFISLNKARKTIIQSFFSENINQLDYIKFPRFNFINCYQIQKNYPNIRFRWYLTVSYIGLDSIYEGNFEDSMSNNFSGRGVFLYGNGIRFEGEWKSDFREGKGIITYPNGVTYEGEWKNDKREGMGKQTYFNGNIYGNEIDFDGAIYEGEWKSDNRDGIGKQTYFNGSIYEGEWKEDKREGIGKLINSDGSIYEGKWKNGEKLER